MKFAVIGGDMRHAKLCELLALDRHLVTAFAIDKLKLEDGVVQTDDIKEAADGAECVIFPLPMTTKDAFLNAPLSNGIHSTHKIISALHPQQVICAGKIDCLSYELANEFGLHLVDYLEREEFAVLNAVAAAEGALQLIMEETPVTVFNLNCLVLGFGRISKILCHRLHGLSADVTCAARECADLAWIKAYGYKALDLAELDGRLSKFDVIINTIPARVLPYQRLQELKSGALCLDLASKPGGLDFTAASRLGVRAMWALSLPGEVAPVSSGAVIRDTIYNILKEKGNM